MSDDILTAEKFLEVTRNSKSISVGEDMSNGGLWVVVRYHSTEHDDEIVKTWQGPDPHTTEYAVYMKFLAELYSMPSLQNFVETYLKRHLRMLGRMTT